jgi:serine/threonine-protein kinase
VAIKVLWPHLAQRDEEVQRIFRATRTMYTLRHPHVISLRQAGKAGPYCWFAMDYIEGESLTQVIDRIGVAGMLDWRYALRVGQHVGEALRFAHEHHIVHRNITPQNVMVRASDKTALLGDLALAKALEGALAQQITQPGEVLGDARYMSPERLVGTVPVDERSDLYSLGALLYALLTGRPPLAGTSVLETIRLIHTAEPVRPKKYQLSISDLFEGVVLKLLAKRPEERYQRAADLLGQLERVVKYQGGKG